MIALILGARGQLGSALRALKPDDVALVARDFSQLDLTDPKEIARTIADVKPDVVINAAAYTAVDKAETEVELAFRVNEFGAGSVAQSAEIHNARMIHVSTDYVFDGRKSSPYQPDDSPTPLSVYGKSKLAGEKAAIANCQNCLVVRTAWLYSSEGSNFVKTMLRHMANRPAVRVVDDQVGTPTCARSLAQALWDLARTDYRGVLHYTDTGVASWYDFACAIQEEALTQGLLGKAVSIQPIPTSDFPLPAPRPAYSVLEKGDTWAVLNRSASHWRKNLREILGHIRNE